MTFGLSDVVSESTVGALFIALPTGFANLGFIGRILASIFFGLAFIAVSARIWLPGDMIAPAPMG